MEPSQAEFSGSILNIILKYDRLKEFWISRTKGSAPFFVIFEYFACPSMELWSDPNLVKSGSTKSFALEMKFQMDMYFETYVSHRKLVRGFSSCPASHGLILSKSRLLGVRRLDFSFSLLFLFCKVVCDLSSLGFSASDFSPFLYYNYLSAKRKKKELCKNKEQTYTKNVNFII